MAGFSSYISHSTSIGADIGFVSVKINPYYQTPSQIDEKIAKRTLLINKHIYSKVILIPKNKMENTQCPLWSTIKHFQTPSPINHVMCKMKMC